MKSLKNSLSVLLLSIVMLSFSQCATTKKLESKSPINYDQVYYQDWVAGVEGGGAGTNIFIPTKNTSVVLDSVYFRGKVAKLLLDQPNKNIYIGRFSSQKNRKPHDIIMSSDAKAEYGNKMPVKTGKIPFELKPNECIVSYKDGKKTKYFKIENVLEEKPIHYPMVKKH